MKTILKNWQTTLAGVAAFAVTWGGVIQQWLAQVKDIQIGPLQWVGLITLIMGVVAKDHNKTGV